VSSDLLQQALPGSTLVVAIDPGKVTHRVWFSTSDGGLLEEPRSVPALRPGLDEIEATIRRLVGVTAPVVAIEATGALHGPWVRALEERFPSSVRVFAPSETAAARAQLGSRRFKSDDRDCAALTYLARQGQGRPVVEDPVEAMRAAVRAERLGRSVTRWQAIRADVAAVETEIETLLATTAGQVLTTLPGVGVIRAAGFAAFSLPIERFPSAEHLYSATGLAPARYQSATINRTGRISRTGLAEHRDALMGIAWGLSQRCAPFAERDAELRARGMAPIQARVALARHACRLTYRMLHTQQPFDEQRYRQSRHPSGR
jgi:transposase